MFFVSAEEKGKKDGSVHAHTDGSGWCFSLTGAGVFYCHAEGSERCLDSDGSGRCLG